MENQELTHYSGSFSWVEELIHAGIKWKEGRKIPSKEECHHKSTRYRNGDTRFPFEFDAKDGYLLLCSDGLSNMTSPNN